jgi:hypothetical protein
MTYPQFVPVETRARHFTVSVSCIRGWLRQGRIPKNTYIKVGNTYRFNIDAVIKALIAEPDDDVKPVVESVEVGIASAPVQLELDFINPDADL